MRTVDQAVLDRLIFFLDSPLGGRVYGKLESVKQQKKESRGRAMEHKKIVIKGLKQNNLKNISLDIPKQKIVVFTGVSGSGKSPTCPLDSVSTGMRRNRGRCKYSVHIRCFPL